MVELKGKKLLATTILSLLILGALGYNALPEAYCPLEDKTVHYVHMSSTQKTVTKVIPEGESWRILDDRCQKGREIGQWIPINSDLAKQQELECPPCEVCPRGDECPDCEVEPYTCPSGKYCPACPKQKPCVQTCKGCGGGGGGSCPTCTPEEKECPSVNVIAYLPNDDCTDVDKYFCSGIGEGQNCIHSDDLSEELLDDLMCW